jgi:hypothetical protein
MYGDEARKELHKLAREFWKWGIPATGRYVKEAATFDENGVPVHIPSPKGTMLKKIAVAAALFAIGYILSKQRKKASGITKLAMGKLGSSLKSSAMGAIGAAAPASAAMPNIPLIPAI